MKLNRFLAAAGAAALLTLSPAFAAGTPSVAINGLDAGNLAMATLLNDTTYVSLRNVSALLDSGAVITWEAGTAYVRGESVQFSARPDDLYVTINGESVDVPHGVIHSQGRVLVPIRVLAQAFQASVYWNSASGEVVVNSRSKPDASTYSADDLYWLSRIISAESRGEPLEGKIAVGNVVLNRVASPEFPDNIYDVIFDGRWGGQFEPVRNGTIYNEPTEESVQAAKLCLEGANTAGSSLYFLAPALAQNFWVPGNREYVTTIGCHDFYL